MVDKLAAEVAKLTAETAEIEARMARESAAAEQTAKRNSLRMRALELAVEEKEASVSTTRMAVRLGRIEVAKAERDEKLLLTDWRFAHTLNFVGYVDKGTTQAAIDRLHQFTITDPGCDITVTFNSPGGSVMDGMALFDYIRFVRGLGHKVTTIALGYAASMGGILLQAGDVRVMAKGSWLLIHEVAFGAAGKIGEVEDTLEFGKRLKEQAANIFIERAGGKLTRARLEKEWKRRDWWLQPDEALSLGLIDEVR